VFSVLAAALLLVFQGEITGAGAGFTWFDDEPVDDDDDLEPFRARLLLLCCESDGEMKLNKSMLTLLGRGDDVSWSSDDSVVDPVCVVCWVLIVFTNGLFNKESYYLKGIIMSWRDTYRYCGFDMLVLDGLLLRLFDVVRVGRIFDSLGLVWVFFWVVIVSDCCLGRVFRLDLDLSSLSPPFLLAAGEEAFGGDVRRLSFDDFCLSDDILLAASLNDFCRSSSEMIGDEEAEDDDDEVDEDEYEGEMSCVVLVWMVSRLDDVVDVDVDEIDGDTLTNWFAVEDDE
jgi:hypothetical protein